MSPARGGSSSPIRWTTSRGFAKSLAAILLPLHWPVVFILVAAWFWRQGASPYGVLFGVAWALWTLLAPPWRVRLLDDAIAVDYLGRGREIAYADIVVVRLEDRKAFRDKETTGGVATVIIETTHGGTTQLAGFKDGSLALFTALDDAWKRGGPPK